MAYLGLVFSMFEILWFSPTLEFSLMSQNEIFFFPFFFMYFLDVCVLGQELKYFQR